MTLLSDIFNPTLLIILGITLLLLALLVVYFESKMRDQNHKIASMLSLVSSLAEETGHIKMHLNHMNIIGAGSSGISGNNMMHENNVVNNSNFNTTKYVDPNLITVSDNDAEDDTNSDDDSENSDDEYDDSDISDTDSDNDSDDDKNKNITINEINENDIKVLNLGNLDDEFYNSDNKGKYNNREVYDDDDEDVDDADDEDDENTLEDINYDQLSDNDSVLDISKSIVKIETENTTSESMDTGLELDNNDNNLKSIKILTLEEDIKSAELIDYKKLSLNKLKSVVLEKGLSQDPSKLKKHELLKLLNAE
jgi:hypothetical protein